MSGTYCNGSRTRVVQAMMGIGVVLVLLGISGCFSLPRDKKPPSPARISELIKPHAVMPEKAELWSETPLVVDQVTPPPDASVQVRSQLPERRVESPTKTPISQYPDNLIKGMADPDAKVQVNLNFDAIQMTELVEAFAQLLDFSYLVDPAVANKGAVTINVQGEMTAREAWETFEHILWLSGAYASRNPGFIHILPFDKMPKERRLLFDYKTMANVDVAFVHIRYQKSANIAALIDPFKTDGATIKDLPESNTLLIVESPANMPKMRELISLLDNKGEAAWPHICIPCRNVDADELADELKALLPVLGFPVTDKGPSGGMIKITSLPRLQCVVASAAMQDVLDEVERWIRTLDTADTMEKQNIYWYNVKHSTADQLREVLDVFFNTESTVGQRPSRTKGTSSKASATSGRSDETSSRSEDRSASRARSTSSRSSHTKRNKAEHNGNTIFDTPVVVLVDEVRERLTIKTTQRAYTLIQALLERHDVAPRQVAIQALIAEVILTKSTEYGFSYTAQKLISSNDNVLGFSSHGAGAIPSDVSSEPFAFLFTGKGGDPLAFIKAVAGKANTKVLSEPQVVVLSGETATVNVGERVPVPTESTNYSGDPSNFRTNYEYEDTGVIMDVTPYVTAGNDVRLEVRQEVSDAEPNEDPTIPPRITNKVVESVLSVPDGATVLMGGLIKTKNTRAHFGWAFLMDMPGIGWLFRSNRITGGRAELLILLTVNVISKDTQMEQLINRFRASLDEIRTRQEEAHQHD